MLALYRSGRQADALDAFHEARRVLSDEPGTRAWPGASQLCRRRSWRRTRRSPRCPVVPARRGNLPAPATSFVGREAELAQVAACLPSTAS